jgi:NTP pyrophosphatase (non-canonical NTP hydrolase)
MTDTFNPNVEDPDDLVVLRRSDFITLLTTPGMAYSEEGALDCLSVFELPLMTIPQIQKQCYEDSARFFPNADPDDLTIIALGMSGEAGEFADEIKKMLRSGDHTVTPERYEKLVEESTDTFIYSLLALKALRADPTHAYRIKRARNEERFL